MADAGAMSGLLKPDVVIMVIRLPDGSGIDACREILTAAPRPEFSFSRHTRKSMFSNGQSGPELTASFQKESVPKTICKRSKRSRPDGTCSTVREQNGSSRSLDTLR